MGAAHRDSPLDPFNNGSCITRGSAGDSCTGLGQGTCSSSLVCDVIGECRHSPPQSDEPCGVGVGCASGLSCSALIGGRCQAPGESGDACSGIGQGSCQNGLLCDALRECRHDVPPQMALLKCHSLSAAFHPPAAEVVAEAVEAAVCWYCCCLCYRYTGIGAADRIRNAV